MHSNDDLITVEKELLAYFSSLHQTAQAQGLVRDSAWTRAINSHVADIGHRFGYLVFASRCDSAIDGPEWLYDHHWRVADPSGDLLNIPLAMEIEWGFGRHKIEEKIAEDFTKLVQAKARLRIMVFQCDNVSVTTNLLVEIVRKFGGTETGDRYLFAGYDWNTQEMLCRLFIA